MDAVPALRDIVQSLAEPSSKSSMRSPDVGVGVTVGVGVSVGVGVIVGVGVGVGVGVSVGVGVDVGVGVGVGVAPPLVMTSRIGWFVASLLSNLVP